MEQHIEQLSEIVRNAEKMFGQLSDEQLNWKPGENQWSIAQCFDHLITSNNRYFPQFEQILQEKKRQTFWESLPILPAMWGKMLIKSLNPDGKSKFKTYPVFEPASSEISGTIIKDFAAHQEKLKKYFSKLEPFSRSDIKISSPVSSFITYSLADVFEILTIHELRHFKQAERVLKLMNKR